MRSWMFVALAGLLGSTGSCTHHAAPTAAPAGMVAGLVRDATTGAGIAGVELQLQRVGATAPVIDHANGDGAYLIPALPPGRYHVSAAIGPRVIGERDIEVRAEQLTGVDFTVPTTGAALDPAAPDSAVLWRFRPPGADPAVAVIEGTVADSTRHERLRGAVVTLVPTGTLDAIPTITDDQGRFRVDGLAPGSYDVSADYQVVRRGALQVRRTHVDVAGGETVVVPLLLEVDAE